MQSAQWLFTKISSDASTKLTEGRDSCGGEYLTISILDTANHVSTGRRASSRSMLEIDHSSSMVSLARLGRSPEALGRHDFQSNVLHVT